MAKNTFIYLVEHWWYSSYQLIAAYDTLEAAINHCNFQGVLDVFGKTLVVREIGLRSKLQYKKVHERYIDKSEVYPE